MVVKVFHCFIHLLLRCVPFSCHYIMLVRIGFLCFRAQFLYWLRSFLDVSASLSKFISSTSALPEVDGVTCGSSVLVVSLSCSDTCGVSGTRGTSDTRGISGTHGTSGTCCASGTCGASGTHGTCVVGSIVPISGFVSALTFSFLPRNGITGNLLITLAACTFVICSTIAQSHSYSLPIMWKASTTVARLVSTSFLS